MSEPHLLTLDTAAARLAVSVRTVRRLITAGDLPSVRIRAARRILAGDLADYIAKSLDPGNNPSGVVAKGDTTWHDNGNKTRTAFTNGRIRPTGGPVSRELAGAALARVLGFPSPTTRKG